MLLPALGRAKLKALGIQCMSNHRQLTLAWRMYSDDNRDYLPPASGGSIDTAPPWVTGNMNFNPANASNWDPSVDIMKSPLWQYCGKNTGIWRCPQDHSSVTVNGVRKPRVRSMSMNFWFGGFGGSDGGLSGGIWKLYFKMSDLMDPGPSRTWLLMDMREDSIDIGNFATDMRGWSDDPSQTGFYDLPASYHGQAGGLSFADGHAELRKWRDPRTMPLLVKDALIPDHLPSPNNPYIVWLQERSTRKK